MLFSREFFEFGGFFLEWDFCEEFGIGVRQSIKSKVKCSVWRWGVQSTGKFEWTDDWILQSSRAPSGIRNQRSKSAKVSGNGRLDQPASLQGNDCEAQINRNFRDVWGPESQGALLIIVEKSHLFLGVVRWNWGAVDILRASLARLKATDNWRYQSFWWIVTPTMFKVQDSGNNISSSTPDRSARGCSACF